MQRYIFLFIGVILLSSCTSKSKWQHDIQIVNPKTRSEGKRGHLYYESKEIDYIKSRLMVPIGVFEYREGKMPWEDHGWFIIKDQDTKKKKNSQIYLIDMNIWIEPRDIEKYYHRRNKNK